MESIWVARNVFANPRSTCELSQTLCGRIYQFATPSAAGEVPVLISTGALVTREEEQIGNNIAVNHKILWSFEYSIEFYGCTANTADIGTSI